MKNTACANVLFVSLNILLSLFLLLLFTPGVDWLFVGGCDHAYPVLNDSDILVTVGVPPADTSTALPSCDWLAPSISRTQGELVVLHSCQVPLGVFTGSACKACFAAINK